jgi:hypothetical protein
MKRKLLTVSCLLSLLLCLATVVLWVRSRRVHSRVGYSTSQARFTLHSVDGALIFSGPPAGTDDPKVRDLVSGMSNSDVVFKLGGGGGGIKSWDFRDGSGKRLMQNWVNSRFKPLDPKPLLRALDDPNRVVAAHMVLIWTRPRVGPFPLPSLENNTVSQDYDGLLVRGTPSVSEFATADPSGWRAIRDKWHDRLDRQITRVRYLWLVAATAVLPLFWFTAKYRQIRRRRLPGVCHTCFYDLTGNTSGVCPECGTAISPRIAAAFKNKSPRPA